MLAFGHIFKNMMKSGRRPLSTFDTYLEIDKNGKETLKFHYFWLRDHCRCSECYNNVTEQINFNIVEDIPLDLKPLSCIESEDKLSIIWQDNHRSDFSLNWLRATNIFHKNTKYKSLKETVLWDKNKIEDIKDSRVSCKDYFKDDNGLTNLLKSILKYGFGFVTGVEPTLRATEKIVTKMAPIQTTLFGGMWEVLNNAEHNDTAYSQIGLVPHTDNTYFTDPAGLQIFHMLSHEGTGGETLLVDGFNGCNNLKLKNEKAFNILCNYPIRAKYLEKGYHYNMTDSVIKLHPVTNDFYHLRYNILDRDTFNTVPFEDMMDFYEAYKLLGKELFHAKSIWSLKLQPGDIIFIDNWRVLHGRSTYTGVRNLCGCYVTRADWISKAQVLGLHTY